MSIEQLAHRQTKATKAKISKNMMGKKNSQWKDGRHPDYYRRIAGAKKGDGSVIHHKDENRHNGAKSNLRKIPKAQRGKHDSIHNRAANFRKGKGKK